MNKIIYPVALFFILLGLAISCSEDDDFWSSSIPETEEEPTQSQISGYVFKPAVQMPTDENIQQLQLPEGFKIQKICRKFGRSQNDGGK